MTDEQQQNDQTDELTAVQQRLDDIQAQIVANKEERRKIALELREEYIREERLRERLLRESLTASSSSKDVN